MRIALGIAGIAVVVGTSPLTAGGGEDIAALAKQIDARIAARWAEEKVEPAPPADDAEFLRRTCLNIAGRIPSVSEVEQFLDDTRADKRRRIVDRVLAGGGYPSHFAEVLRSAMIPEVNTDPLLQFRELPFDQWLRRRVAENAGYDQIVRELLMADVNSPGPGFYYIAKGGKPENLAGGAARIFLGVRIECAQCHNHPFAKWKREQFWELAAFFSRVQPREGGASEGDGPAELKIPDTNKVVRARTLGDWQPATGATSQPRGALAAWMTAGANPYFAKAAVNRVWAHFMGTGLVDPIDDFDESNPPSHPELLDELAGSFVQHHCDLKFLVRALCASRAYQLSSVQTNSKQASRRLFARGPVKGLSASELSASLAQALGEKESEQSAMAGPNDGNRTALQTMIAQLFRSENAEPVDSEATILQALALMNSPVINELASPAGGNTLQAVLDAPFLDTPSRIETLYLATLSRRPTAAETRRLVNYVDSGGAHSASKPKLNNVFQQVIARDRAKSRSDKQIALGDILWALLNSSEFLTNH